MEDSAVTRFREYLRIKTVPPNPDYDGAVVFLRKQASEVGLSCHVYEHYPGKPIVLMTWKGKDPTLPSILLNSHMDVVPVFPEHWKYDPFEAVKTSDGDIYARGSQDMKCVGMQYLEAIRQLKSKGVSLLRTVHLTFVPDEETGGVLGMKAFVKTEDFKKLNLGFALDEGYANPTDSFTVFYGERLCVWIKVTCTGNPGHGSQFIENTAAEKLRNVINNFMNYREKEKKRKEENKLPLGSVTTVNMNIIKGGVQENVVPAEMTATFDIRVTPTFDLTEFDEMIKGFVHSAGEGVSYEYLQKSGTSNMTSITDDSPWWRAFNSACENMNLDIVCEIFPAATDCRYIREVGYPALGFSPMNRTPILLHDHNEFLNEKIFLKGIDIYSQIIPAIANVSKF